MEGLTNLISSFSDAIAPVINFVIWIFPLKFYRIHDGENGLILTFGKVRRKKNTRKSGMCFVSMFEEVMVEQVIGRYLDLSEQVLMIKCESVVVVNGCVEFSIFDLKKALLEIEDIEKIVESVCMNQVREYSRNKSLTELLDNEKILNDLKTKINRLLKKYGTKIDNFMLTDLRPHEVSMACKSISNNTDKIVKCINERTTTCK